MIEGAFMQEHQIESFTCLKCSSRTAETGSIRTTGSGLSRFLNLQNQKYNALSCTECGFTEFYRETGGSKLASVFDILSN